MKEIFLLEYDHSDNIGDNIQTFVSKSILESLGFKVSYVNQDDLGKAHSPKVVFINGFFCFTDSKEIFPFNKNITPLFSNLHIELDYDKRIELEKTFFQDYENISYFKKFEPIGCRNVGTQKILEKYGIKSQNNDCITLLLEKRTKEEAKNAKKTIFVDIDEFVPVPRKIKKNSEYMSHFLTSHQIYSNADKLEISEKLLKYYKENAKVIVTSKFHCAIPCIAMGIPVIFFGDPKSTRLSPLKKYVKIHPYINLGLRNRSQFRKAKLLNKIPLLNKKIHFAFSTADYIYTLFAKIGLTLGYLLGILKVDSQIQSCDVESEKDKKIGEILKLVGAKDKDPSKVRARFQK